MDMNAFSLKGKTAWITGASYGIGFAIAEAYAAAGATIVLTISTRNWWIRDLRHMRKKELTRRAMSAT